MTSRRWWVEEGSLPFVAERILRGAAPRSYATLRRLRGRRSPPASPEPAVALAPDAEEKARPEYCRTVFEHHAPHAPASGRVLELGPGSSLGPCSLFARRGHEAWALDRFAWELDDELRALYEALGTADRVPRREIGPAEAMPFPAGHFSFVYSHATLEHVLDPAAVVGELARVLTAGGATSHQVDAADHRRRDRPLDYLRVPGWAWEAMFSDADDYQNRWRVSQYERAFRARFHEVEIHVAAHASAAQVGDPRRFARPFRTMAPTDLTPIDFLIVARRPRR